MATDFGITPNGFVPQRQADVQADLQAAWVSAFGANVNLSPTSNNGQLIGVMSERFALLWELLEAIYNSQYPSGAEGISVDNILALNNLSRLGATASTTNNTPVVQSNGITLYGLVVTGTPGTTVPKGALIADTQSPPDVFSIDADIVIQPAASAVQTLILSGTPTSGVFTLKLVAPSQATVTTANISYLARAQQVLLWWNAAPTSGTFTLTMGGVQTSALNFDASAAAVQAALRTASGSSTLTVTGSIGAGMYVSFASGPIPSLVASADAAAPAVIGSVQGAINQLVDTDGSQPFTDVSVTQTSAAFVFAFGANTPTSGQPSSAGKPQAVMRIGQNTLLAQNTQINLAVASTVAGAPAQGVGSATAAATGPIQVGANALTVIQTPVNGWAGVQNPLAIVPGRNVESDTDALRRRATLLSAQAQGPVAAVLQAVLQVANVTAALAFQNLTLAAEQVVTFSATPTQGTFALALAQGTTSALPYTATALQMQAAIQALPAYSTALVSGNSTYGFVINFNGAGGGQAIDLLSITNNTTGVAIAVRYGRPPKSLEIVVQGGLDADIARAIYSQSVAGLSTYASPVLVTTGTTAAGSPALQVTDTGGIVQGLSVSGFGINPGTTVLSLSNNVVTMSQAALSSYGNTAITFNHTTQIADSQGNAVLVGFSRPTQVPIYVSVVLTTDLYNTPGVPSSGANGAALFNPASIATIQNNLVALGNQVPIGGTVVAYGTNGLIGAFNAVPGVVGYQLTFGTTSGPTTQQNIALTRTQAPYFSPFTTNVSFT